MGHLTFLVAILTLESLIIKPIVSVTQIDLVNRIREANLLYDTFLFKRAAGIAPETPEKILGLSGGEDLEKVTSAQTVDGTTKTKLQETYKGLKVLGETVVMEQKADGRYTEDVSGRLVEGIKKDVPDIRPKISASKALAIAVKKEGDNRKFVQFNPKTDARLEIYISGKNKDSQTVEVMKVKGTLKAKLVYVLTYLVERKGETSKPYYIIDAKTGEVIEKWQSIETESEASSRKQSSRYPSVGGNVKGGFYKYDGKQKPKLKITRVGNTCIMENYAVRVIHMFHRYRNTKPFQFDCKKGFNDSANGGFSPASDVLHHATVVYDMYQRWYNTTPLKFKIVARVHYGRKYDNAFWNRRVVTFGDGYRYFYPLVSLDVVGHEIGHGIVGQNSGLRYRGQSGGMNEAFADLTGEAAEKFARGKVDWLVGGILMKNRSALRYYIDPTKDGKSIAMSADFCNTPVHYSSGVFRRAFYLLVHKPGWGIKKAYTAFVRANKLYWRYDSDFADGACGVVKAAVDLGYETEDIREAFASVGIAPCQKEPLIYNNLRGHKDKPILFKWNIPPGTSSFHVRTTMGRGNVNVYVRRGSIPTKKIYDSASTNLGNEETLTTVNPPPGRYYVLLTSPTSFSGVGMVADVDVSFAKSENTIVENLDSCGIRRRNDMLRVTFTIPRDVRKFVLHARSSYGHAHMYIRRGAPVDTRKYRGYDKSLYISTRGTVSTSCNMKAGVYHVLIGSERRVRGVTVRYGYKEYPVRINTNSKG